MPKFMITFENGTIKKELTFRGETFTNTMQPWDGGSRTSIEKALEVQYEEKHEGEDDCEEITEVIDSLGFGSEDEIEEALEELRLYED